MPIIVMADKNMVLSCCIKVTLLGPQGALPICTGAFKCRLSLYTNLILHIVRQGS